MMEDSNYCFMGPRWDHVLKHVVLSGREDPDSYFEQAKFSNVAPA